MHLFGEISFLYPRQNTDSNSSKKISRFFQRCSLGWAYSIHVDFYNTEVRCLLHGVMIFSLAIFPLGCNFHMVRNYIFLSLVICKLPGTMLINWMSCFHLINKIIVWGHIHEVLFSRGTKRNNSRPGKTN